MHSKNYEPQFASKQKSSHPTYNSRIIKSISIFADKISRIYLSRQEIVNFAIRIIDPRDFRGAKASPARCC